MSTPSNVILPPQISTILVKALARVDLPAPVLPTIPTFSPPLMLTLSPLITRSDFLVYLSSTFSHLIAPA